MKIHEYQAKAKKERGMHFLRSNRARGLLS